MEESQAPKAPPGMGAALLPVMAGPGVGPQAPQAPQARLSLSNRPVRAPRAGDCFPRRM